MSVKNQKDWTSIRLPKKLMPKLRANRLHQYEPLYVMLDRLLGYPEEKKETEEVEK